MNMLRKCATIIVIFMFALSVIFLPAAFAGVDEWTSNGPDNGEVLSLAVSPNYAADGTVFAGTWGGGVYKSTNGGQSWMTVITAIAASSLIISPNYAADDTVFAGTTSGVLKSSNGGQEWTQVLTDGINEIAISPGYATDNTVFAATQNGIYKSTNGGQGWSQVRSGSTRAIALSPSYNTDNTIFTGLFGGGVYKSTDGGQNWTQVNNGLISTQIESIKISPSYANDNSVFVGTYAGGAHKSTNGGQSWIQINTYGAELAISPNYASDNTIFSSGLGVSKSTNGGQSWTSSYEEINTTIRALSVSPNYTSDNTVFIGTRSGVYKSINGGQNWERHNAGLRNAAIYSLAVSPTYAIDNAIFAGSVGAIHKSTNGGQNWTLANTHKENNVKSLAVSPDYDNDNTIFAAFYGTQKSTDGGQNWIQVATGDAYYLAISPGFAIDKTIFSVSSAGMLKSTNGGQSWIASFLNSNVSAIAISPGYTIDNTVYASTTNAGVYKSTNGGQSWTQVNTGFQSANINEIAISPGYAVDNTVYAASSNSGVYKSTNGGQSWTQVSTVLTSSLALSPNYATDSTILIEDAGSILKSTNSGLNWFPFNIGKPAFSFFNKLAFSPNFATDKTIFAGSQRHGVSSYTFTDTTMPLTSLSINPISSDGTNGWFKSIPNVIISKNEPGTIYYQWDSSTTTWNTYTTSFSAPSGQHTLYYYAIDNAGNAESIKSQLFKVDTSLPTDPTTVNSSSHMAGSPSNDNTVDTNWSGAIDSVSGVDGYSVTWSQQSSSLPDAIKDLEESANSITSPILTNGEWYFHLRTVDNAGNWTSTVHIGPFIIDQTPPESGIGTVPAVADGNNDWFKTSPTITLTRNEPGYTRMQFADTTPTLIEPDWVTADTTTALEGINTLYFYSVDTANNTETIQSQEFKVDTSSPTIFNQNLPANSVTVNKPYPYFSWNDASDAISGLDKYGLYIDGVLQRETSASITSAVPSGALTNGAHAWFVRAWDNAGNYRDSVSRNMTMNAGPGKIAFSSDRDGNEGIYVMNADGTSQARLSQNVGMDDYPTWSPDGSKIAFVSSRDANAEIYIMNADGSGQTRLTTNQAYDHDPAWSPDSARIAFTSHRDGNYEIYIMNADGSGQTRLTNELESDHAPSWSPDGTKIAFYSHRDGNYEIYIMNADGSNQTRLTQSLGAEAFPSWSPDGNKLTFHSDRDNNFQNYADQNWEIYVMNADGSGQARVTQNQIIDIFPVWSSDGTKIAFSNGPINNYLEIFSMNTDGSGLLNLTNNGARDSNPDWGPSSPIDIPPITTLNSTPTSPNGANLWYKTKPSATLSRNEPGSTYFQWDSSSSGGWQVADSFFDVFTELQTEGQHTLYYYSVDTANNTETVKNQLFKIDTGGPTASSLSGSAVSATQINLSWTSASDLVSGLAGYKIYNANSNAELATKASGTVSHSFSGLQSNTTYRYYLKAFDSAGNLSLQSNTLTITTPAGVDTAPPSTPSLSGYADDGKAKLSWSAASDNVGVSGYKIYDANTLLEIAGTAATSYSVDGLIPNTYQYYVKAYDGANNYSAPSDAVAITVPSHEASETIDGGVGGDVETPDRKAHIHLPPNAKPGSILITISRNDDSFPPIGGKNKNSSVYIFGPDGTTFDTPVTITLAYDPSADPNMIDVHWYNPQTSDWEIVTSGKTIDTVAHTISVTVTHFSTYTVLSGSPATGVNTYLELIIGLLCLLAGFMMMGNSYRRHQRRLIP